MYLRVNCKFVALIFGAVVFWLPPPASADDSRSVQTFLEACNAEDASPKAFYCVGTIHGIVDTLTMNGVINNRAQRKSPEFVRFSICPPQGTTVGANVQAFKNWANAHPEQWSTPDLLGVLIALRETWPCR
ncbi:Rap1a/Tai family immunity protein [Mesorhizobium sp.]|uniref:Rap1a/Tai family immunity protein n=1 Tax=Mesorhizobium sp. TaxID=1871066 RepID=UPI0026962C15